MFGLSSIEKGLVNERKFIAPAQLAPLAHQILLIHCLPDPVYPVGQIRSIYFDSPDGSAFDEKANGDNLKGKIRIRWYEDEQAAPDARVPVFIESKQRRGSARRKFRHETTAPQHWLASTPLEDSSICSFLQQQAEGLGLPVPPHWIPSVCIAYERHRFVCPLDGTRVALDMHIRCDRVNTLQFPFCVPIRLPQVVCEYKNPAGTPPAWAEQLFQTGFRLRSFSKYGECINQLKLGGAPHEYDYP